MEGRREQPGRFVFHDLMSDDVGRSTSFYGSLFPEWEIQEIDLGDAGSYHSISIDGLRRGGIVPFAANANVASHWVGYVEVADCEATIDRAISDGGTVPVSMMDVPYMGKFSVIMDRENALTKALEPASPIEYPDRPSSGQFCWNELLTTDVSSARSFYQSVFGWSAIEQSLPGKGEYSLMRAGEQDVAGIMPMALDANHDPAWLTYFYAEDLDERFIQAETLGATTVILPRDISGVGRFTVLVDPVGALFAMMCLS